MTTHSILVFLLSCFCHPLHSSTNVPQVPSAHIMFRCHTCHGSNCSDSSMQLILISFSLSNLLFPTLSFPFISFILKITWLHPCLMEATQIYCATAKTT